MVIETVVIVIFCEILRTFLPIFGKLLPVFLSVFLAVFGNILPVFTLLVPSLLPVILQKSGSRYHHRFAVHRRADTPSYRPLKFAFRQTQ